TANGVCLPGGEYCDMFAFRDMTGQRPFGFPIRMEPGSCPEGGRVPAIAALPSGTHTPEPTMKPYSPGCEFIGGEATFRAVSAFGGWALYNADTLREAAHCVYASS